jgi:hypothetical protein
MKCGAVKSFPTVSINEFLPLLYTFTVQFRGEIRYKPSAHNDVEHVSCKQAPGRLFLYCGGKQNDMYMCTVTPCESHKVKNALVLSTCLCLPSDSTLDRNYLTL